MKRVLYLLTLCFFGLTAFQEPDQACDAEKVADEGKTPTSRSLSTTPKSFFDLEVLDILSQQLEEVSLRRTPTQTPITTPTPAGAQTDSFPLAIQKELEIARRLKARKLRAAIRCITAQEKIRTSDKEPATGKRMRNDSVDIEDEGSPLSPAKSKTRYSAPGEASDLSRFETKPE